MLRKEYVLKNMYYSLPDGTKKTLKKWVRIVAVSRNHLHCLPSADSSQQSSPVGHRGDNEQVN